jgi:hypothetical protein
VSEQVTVCRQCLAWDRAGELIAWKNTRGIAEVEFILGCIFSRVATGSARLNPFGSDKRVKSPRLTAGYIATTTSGSDP